MPKEVSAPRICPFCKSKRWSELGVEDWAKRLLASIDWGVVTDEEILAAGKGLAGKLGVELGGLKRYYLHGDVREEDGAVYCARCDGFEGEEHFGAGGPHAGEEEEKVTDYERYEISRKRFYEAEGAGRGGGDFRPAGAKNIFG